MYTKKNTRVTFRSNKRPNFKRNSNYSSGKTRNKGNVTQQYNKYLKLAKEAFSSGDRIQSEYYYQFTDHYYRLMLELGLNIDETENQEDKITDETQDQVILNNENNDDLDTKQNKEVTEVEVETADSNTDDISSIESIPFISKPVKKKVSRVKKA